MPCNTPFALRYRLTIKGGETSEAVLCSETATYSLRVVESSNSTLLARDVHSDSTDLDASQLPEERTVLALGSVPHVWEVRGYHCVSLIGVQFSCAGQA